MSTGTRRVALLLAAAAWLAGRGAAAGIVTPEALIQGWPARPRDEARALIAKYGEPSAYDEKRLIWYDNAPWEKTVLYRRAPGSFLGLGAKNVLEQSILHGVPEGRLAALESFDSRIAYDKTAGRLSSRAANEGLNFLALNLAHEVAAGERSADEARGFYRRTVKLAAAGKRSAYMDGFLFPVSR